MDAAFNLNGVCEVKEKAAVGFTSTVAMELV